MEDDDSSIPFSPCDDDYGIELLSEPRNSTTISHFIEENSDNVVDLDHDYDLTNRQSFLTNEGLLYSAYFIHNTKIT